MPEQKPEPRKKEEVELSFVQKLMQMGYPAYLEAARVDDLGNPDKEYPTFGFKTALGVKPIAISMPVKEWLLLADAIKKLYEK